MSEQQKKGGNGCLIAFLVFIGIMAAIVIGGYFYITTIFVPQLVSRTLEETGGIDEIRQGLKEANITLKNEDIDQLIETTNNIKGKDIKNIIDNLEHEGPDITTEGLLEIVNDELKLDSLTVIKNNGGWDAVKAEFKNEVSDRKTQAMIKDLMENKRLKNNLPRMTGAVRKTVIAVLEELKETGE